MRAAARIANNKQAEIDLAEIRFRAERKLGELMAAQKELLGTAQGRRSDLGLTETQVETTPITLAEAGIDKHLADRARKYAAIPETEFNATIEDWRERVQEETERVTVNLLSAGEKHVRGTLGTGENEWYTPAAGRLIRCLAIADRSDRLAMNWLREGRRNEVGKAGIDCCGWSASTTPVRLQSASGSRGCGPPDDARS